MNKKNLKKIIEEYNQHFKASSKAERRVILAHDVLDMMKSEFISANQGDYIQFFNEQGVIESLDILDCRFNQSNLLLENSPECDVCMKGALILAKQRQGNALDDCDLTKLENKYNPLKDVFSDRQWDFLEWFFEQTSYDWNDNYEDFVSLKALQFLEESTAPQRMYIAMMMIINKKGKLRPEFFTYKAMKNIKIPKWVK